MFTGIVKGMAIIDSIRDHGGIRTFDIEFTESFCKGLEVGASVSVDGVCLTVTEMLGSKKVRFDVILQSLKVTTLSDCADGELVNVERAAKDGVEIGGHPLSGHIDFCAEIIEIEESQENCRIRFGCDDRWLQYIFPKGYIALNGCSLTISERGDSYFEIWVIPETKRATTFSRKSVGSFVNVEIERGAQVVVETIKKTLEKKLGIIAPDLQSVLEEKGIDLAMSTTQDLARIPNIKGRND